METKYLTVHARRIAVYGQARRVSGGEGVACYTYSSPAKGRGNGNVVSLEDYRRENGLSLDLQGPLEQEPVKDRRTPHWACLLDLAATAAVASVALIVAVKFLLL